jgi:hypothetical protein
MAAPISPEMQQMPMDGQQGQMPMQGQQMQQMPMDGQQGQMVPVYYYPPPIIVVPPEIFAFHDTINKASAVSAESKHQTCSTNAVRLCC